ncbi:MAG: DUF493 domain-containing protein [Succinivibrio sp.]|nr:DUF493 domain-containing protein [Succinivibrio sp.]
MSESTAQALGSLGELLKFPCEITFKIIVEAEHEGVLEAACALMEKLSGQAVSRALTPRRSRRGNYLSYDVTAQVSSEEILRGIYTGVAAISGVRHIM